jgi:hypothetical protein
MVFGVSANIQTKHFPKTSEKIPTRANLLGEEGVKDGIFNYKSVSNKSILGKIFFKELVVAQFVKVCFALLKPKFISLLCSNYSVMRLCLDPRESLLHSFMLFGPNSSLSDSRKVTALPRFMRV